MVGVAELIGFGIVGDMVWDLLKYAGKDTLDHIGVWRSKGTTNHVE